ncbi:hypothetical protein HanRHA438_Chr06g0275191 [Helianthus annuus]|uniref:Uncharacterized protein n=1 Tax=Helianthus annuus TaxID=4232 RepID=A0A251UJA3_HELAN|nr:hypothetical protein HanXRQr2_Chr06g0266161 [Helianthus annuus]KAJ0912512.1 hypothetical protein HanRHA438_Chr06g0275191 [Helianthus annuus]
MTMVVAQRRSSGVWYSGGWLRRTCAAAGYGGRVRRLPFLLRSLPGSVGGLHQQRTEWWGVSCL